MKSKPPKVLFGLLLLFAATTPNANGDEPKVLNYEQAGFTLTLPTGWQEIPPEVLKSLIETTSKLSGTIRKQPYDFGYQLASSSNWFGYPYILVQVGNTGPIPEEELSKLAKNDSSLNRSVKSAEKNMPSIVTGVGVSDTSFDAQTHSLRMRAQMSVAGAGEVGLLSTIMLTARGTITIHCYARQSEFESFREAFDSVLNSVKLSEELRYRSVPKRPSSIERVFGYALVGGLIGLAMVLVCWLFVGKPPRIRPSGT